MSEPAPSTPDAAARSWVWHATVESRAAGKVSILACVETLVAVVIYWWIAIRWDTHWHLLSSVFIAPLLLLRSPESMRLGVRWFMKDWFGFNDYKEWPRTRRWVWTSGVGVFSGVVTYVFAPWLCGLWLVGAAGWALWGWSVFIVCLSLAFASAVGLAIAVMAAGKVGSGSEWEFDASIVGAIAGAIGIVSANEGSISAVVSGMVFVVVFVVVSIYLIDEDVLAGMGVGVPFSVGFSFRGLIFRVPATLRNLPQGVRHLAENWQENNFWVDSCLPAELMPGIREQDADFTSDSLISAMRGEKSLVFKWVGLPSMAVCLFLPAFLYRLNIKATCWFWWPLAYFLKPIERTKDVEAQHHELTQVYRNPIKLAPLLIGGLILIGIVYHYYNSAATLPLKDPHAVWLPIKVFIGLDWRFFAPWHWALFILEITGVLMLWLGGEALSYHRDYWQKNPPKNVRWKLPTMKWLQRLHLLCFLLFIGFGLGMCLISFPEARSSMPEGLLHRLDTFYHTQELREQARLDSHREAKKKSEE